MRTLSRSMSTPREQDQPEQAQLLFRNVALLYQSKDVLERVRRKGNHDATVPQFIPSMFDEDGTKPSPLAADEEIRVLIAQDDTGVSLDRLLFDSRAAMDNNTTTSNTSALNRSSTPRTSGFIRHQSTRPKDSRNQPVSSRPKPDCTGIPSSPSGFFGHSQHMRRMPAYVSLADAKNDPRVPVEDTKEETDSWLDCVFGKSPMKYKGDNTKVHVLQRQPLNSDLAHWEQEPQPKFGPDDLAKIRKSAILVSRTFTVPIQDEDLPDQFRHKAALDPHSAMNKSDIKCTNTSTRVTTPTFGVAILLPLAKRQDDGQDEPRECQTQLVVNNWHTIVRALDALEAAAAVNIQRKLKEEAEAMSMRYADTLPTASRMLRLKFCALQSSERVAKLADTASARIARAFRVVHVEIRNEWNLWRDELRESSRSGKGLDVAKVGFIQLALTAALSSSLSWMRIFAPLQLQTRLQREARQMEDNYSEAQNRIVVITADHNKARQVIYILSKFTPIAQASARFERSPTNARAASQVSALTQGLKAAGLKLAHPRTEHQADRNLRPVFDAPVFNMPAPSLLSTSPAKQKSSATPTPILPNSASLQRAKSRLDVHTKSTPAMPISSAPGSSYTTPVVSPETRPSSSGGAQGDLLRHLQRNNSALSETSTESSSLWNSFRSVSMNWGFRRDSGATSISENGPGMTSTQRGEAPTSILKTGKTSIGRSGGKKLVRMVEEAEELPRHEIDARKDSAINTPINPDTPSQRTKPTSLADKIEYTYDAAENVVDVHLIGKQVNHRTRKVPASGNHFPLMHTGESATADFSPKHSAGSSAAYDRVAGYLERLHPDFALQAVKPYGCLEDDIKRSMQGERSPKQGFGISEPQFFPLEHWVDVCSTYIVDADSMTVKRITLRRRIRYSLTTSNEAFSTTVAESPYSAIKITRSEEMDDVKRTYRRNDNGNKVDWKDKRIVNSGSGSSSGSGMTSMTSSCDQLEVASSDSTVRPPAVSSRTPKQVGAKENTVTIKLNGSSDQRSLKSGRFGDDLTAFIDTNAKKNNVPRAQPAMAPTRRIATRDKDGKITGWKDADADEPEERGLRDLPASFLGPKRDKLKPAIHERTLEEVFDEEKITKPEPAIASLLEQMLANSETRSAVPSRAGSVHGRTHSRSNSISGSGLSELQYESKKIVEDALEDLVSSVVSERHSPSPSRPSGGFFGLRRGVQESSEGSILRQSISKWLNEE